MRIIPSQYVLAERKDHTLLLVLSAHKHARLFVHKRRHTHESAVDAMGVLDEFIAEGRPLTPSSWCEVSLPEFAVSGSVKAL